MSTMTAWRFSGTEVADDVVVALQQQSVQQAIDVQDAAVLRWPPHSPQPTTQEHVITSHGGKVSAMIGKVKGGGIDSKLLESVGTEMTPGTSALVLMSSDAKLDRLAQALPAGHDMKLIRSSLSVEQEHQIQAAFKDQH